MTLEYQFVKVEVAGDLLRCASCAKYTSCRKAVGMMWIMGDPVIVTERCCGDCQRMLEREMRRTGVIT